MPKKKTKIGIPIYQLKIVLREIEPPIWRVLQIKGNANLGKLHHYLQGTMGWEDCHLHEFIIKGQRYGSYEQFGEEMDDHDMHDEKTIRLNKLFSKGDSFDYIYDFGDYWEHKIVVEKILPRKEGVYYPICLYGERACPPEDCGSSMGYEELLKVLSDPTHEDYEHFREWAGEDYDPEVCDLKKINMVIDNIKSNIREPRT